MNFVASNIKFLRKQLGLSQEQFANAVEMNRGNIASYEKGTAEPSIAKLQKFSDFFNVDITSLIQEDLSKLNIVHELRKSETHMSAKEGSASLNKSMSHLNGTSLGDMGHIVSLLERIAVALEK